MNRRAGRSARRFLVVPGNTTLLAIGLAAAYTIFASLFSLFKHWSYATYTLDLGAFTQSLWFTLQGVPLYLSPAGMSQLGYHFQPILFLLVPFFWIAPRAETLLVIQSLALGAAGYLVYRLARVQRLSPGVALGVEFLFFLSPLVHGVNFFDFHPVALAIPTLLLMIIGLAQRRWSIFALGLILSLMTKEDVIITLGIFGAVMLLYQFLKGRKIERVYLVIFLSSIATYLLAIVVARAASGMSLPPLLMYGSIRYPFITAPLGSMLAQIGDNFFNWRSWFLLFSYLGPLGFLPLLSPLWTAPALFVLAKDMLASEPMQKTLHQYPAPAIPFLFAAFIQVLKQRMPQLHPRWHKTGKFLLIPIIAIVLMINAHPSSVFTTPRVSSWHREAINAVIALIPDGATVTAPATIFPHLAGRTLTYLPYERTRPNRFTGEFGLLELDTEYVIMDLRYPANYRDGYEDERINWSSYIKDKYGVLAYVDGVILFKRGYQEPPRLTALDTVSGLNISLYKDGSFNEKVLDAQFFMPPLGEFMFGSLIPGVTPDNGWSMYLSSYIFVPERGRYEFCLDSDEGAILVIDGEHRLGELGNPLYQRRFRLALDKGFHKIELFYVDSGGAARLNLEWKPPGSLSYQPLVSPQFYRSLPAGATLAKSRPLPEQDVASSILSAVEIEKFELVQHCR
jgi:uncharacterized membrane protein